MKKLVVGIIGCGVLVGIVIHRMNMSGINKTISNPNELDEEVISDIPLDIPMNEIEYEMYSEKIKTAISIDNRHKVATGKMEETLGKINKFRNMDSQPVDYERMFNDLDEL